MFFKKANIIKDCEARGEDKPQEIFLTESENGE